MFGGITKWFSTIFKSISEMFSNIFSVITDLLKSLMGGIQSLFGGLFGGLFHGGGVAGHATSFRFVPRMAFAGAPSYAGGFAPDEYPSILHDNEAVVPLSGGRAIPVDIRGADFAQQAQNINIQVITKDPGTKVVYKPSRSQQRVALVNVQRRGMSDV